MGNWSLGPALRRAGSWLLFGLLSGTCAVVLAQPGPHVSCSASALPTAVYASGIAQPVADILVRCTAPTASLPAVRDDLLLDISLALNVNVTNPVRESAGRLLTDAALVVNGNDCASPSSMGSVFGSCGSPDSSVQDPQLGQYVGEGTLEWAAVSIPFPGAVRPGALARANPAVSTLRIRGVRGNASQLDLGASGGLGGPALVGSLALRSASAVSIRDGTVDLAYPTAGLWISDADEDSVAACHGAQGGLATVHVGEGFPTAFRSEAGASPNPSATRIALTFDDVPDGVTLRVPSAVRCGHFGAGGVVTGSPGALAFGLVRGHGPDGSGGSATTATGSVIPDIAVDLVDGAGDAVFEVVSQDPSRVEDCHIPLQFETDSGQRADAHASVRAGFAPRGAVQATSSTAPLNRFAPLAAGRAARVGVSGCDTTLMFPFVTNQAGFTTGIVITHGSRRALTGDSGEQAGSCDLHYYGALPDGEELLLIQYSTMIEPGDQLVFTLSAGNPDRNILGLNQFQGYVMASCRNPDARGYAFISDGFGGIADLAMGYLAPVVPAGPDGRRLVNTEGSR